MLYDCDSHTSQLPNRRVKYGELSCPDSMGLNVFYCIESFWTNPQYRITIDDHDPDDDSDTGTIVIGVMQKDRRKLKHKAKGNLVIGYYIFQV